jgi:hypothetical protein
MIKKVPPHHQWPWPFSPKASDVVCFSLAVSVGSSCLGYFRMEENAAQRLMCAEYTRIAEWLNPTGA